MTRARLVRLASLLLLGGVVAAIVYAGAFRAHGGQWERVETPSMGTTAPVGSLLWVQPVDFSELRVGDFITFHPPGRPGVTYSHRVHAVAADGTLTTKGEISGVDPWQLHAGDVVGRVTRVWRGVGWVVRATPVLAVGAVLTWGLCLLRRRAALPMAVLGAGLTLAIAIVVYHPLTAAEQVSFVPDAAGGAEATYVSTGLLPVRLEGARDQHADLGPGEVGTVAGRVEGDAGRVAVSLEPHLPPWFWVALVLGCFVPALGSLLVGGAEPTERPVPTVPPGARTRQHRRSTRAPTRRAAGAPVGSAHL